MKHTLVLDNHNRIVPMRATGYSPNPKGGFQTEMSNFEQTGDGAVLTSVEDLLLWDQNFYEPKVGGKAFLDAMQAVGAFNDGRKLDYASGLFIEEYKGLRKVSHGGSWAGYRSELIRFPDQKFSVACLCNLATVNPSALAQRVADLYLAEQFKTTESKASTMRGTSPKLPDPITLTAEQLAEYTGRYYSEELDATYKLAVENGKLFAMDRNESKRSLTPRSRELFTLIQGAQFEFTRDTAGKITGFGVNAGRIRGVRFMKK
ncbi:MAG: DUF3471 domain-containing protein, partial [Saprospiraceae bacterium]